MRIHHLIEMKNFLDCCVGNLELISIIKIVLLNFQKDPFDITFPGKTS